MNAYTSLAANENLADLPMSVVTTAAALRWYDNPSAPLADGSENPSERTATIARNPFFARMPWEIRCFGQGKCTYGDGAPKRFNNRDRAAQVAEVWIETGISPADQRDDGERAQGFVS